MVRGSELQKSVTENELALRVKQAYYQLLYFKGREALLLEQDSVLDRMVKAADLRYRSGESALLEKSTAELQRSEARNLLTQTQADIVSYRQLLAVLMNSREPVDAASAVLEARTLSLSMDTATLRHNPQLAYAQQQVEIAERERKVAGARFMPDIQVGYFNQTLIGTPRNAAGDLATSQNRFQGFEVGLSLPLWFGPQVAKVRAASLQAQKSKSVYEYRESVMQGEWQQAVQEYVKNKNSVDYYQAAALTNASLILRQASTAYLQGEIDYAAFWMATRQVMQIREGYLTSLNNLNQAIIHLEFLAGTR
jgi:cobalt-zinc-cadmium resistance protein CzcA